MKVIKLLIVLIPLVCLLPSCSPVYYEPSSHNVPLMEQKGDLNISGSTNLALNKGEVQASYAVSDHVGVMTNYMIKKFLFDRGDSDIRTSQMYELGVGYFHNPHEKIVLEAYGIIGRGSFDNHITDIGGSLENLTGSMTKYALQLNFGLREKGLDLAYSIKPTQLRFSNLDGNLSYRGQEEKDILSVRDSYTFIEHAITARFGMNGINFQAQIGRGARQFARSDRRLKGYLTFGIFANIRKLQERATKKDLVNEN